MSGLGTAEAAFPLQVPQSEIADLHAALAHEISQPLTSILINAQAALRFLDEGLLDPAEHRKILEDIVRDNKRAVAVIQNLRSMLNHAPIERELCCVNEIVEEVLDFMKSEFASHRAKVRFVPGKDLPKVLAARVEIQQVLVNLLLNAAQSMRETPEPGRVLQITTKSNGTRVITSIRDYGCGVPPEYVTSIFNPFYTTKANGLGIGLTICRRIIEGHLGGIEARSEDPGTTFLFSLAIAEG